MRTWLAGLAGCVVAFASATADEPRPVNTFEALNTELTATTPTSAAQRKALTDAKKVLARRTKDLKADVAKAKELEKLLGKKFATVRGINDGLGAVLDEMEAGVTAQESALVQRTAAQPDGSAKAHAQARADAAAAHLLSAESAASREAKANAIGLALQDVLRGEGYLKDDFYFYAVVNGEGLLATHSFGEQGLPAGTPTMSGDARGGIFVLQFVGTPDTDAPYLYDVVSLAIAGDPKPREYKLQDYMATHSRQTGGTAPDGFREIIVKGSTSFVKFLRVDRKRRIATGIFEFTVHEDYDANKVDYVNYGSFRVRYL